MMSPLCLKLVPVYNQTTTTHLMSPCECCVSVHIVLWLADIDHLVGVELEHALHLQLTVAILWLVWGALGHSLRLQLLPSPLTFSYPSQIPEDQKRMTTMNKTDRVKRNYVRLSHIKRSQLQVKFTRKSKIYKLLFSLEHVISHSIVFVGMHYANINLRT